MNGHSDDVIAWIKSTDELIDWINALPAETGEQQWLAGQYAAWLADRDAQTEYQSWLTELQATGRQPNG